MKPKAIDLHTHTCYSDGTLSPTELVRKAREIGLSAVAVTDHDTTAGIPEAQAAGARFGVEVVAGVEISALHPYGTLHILGYFINPENESLQKQLREYINARNRRNPLILKRLRQFGFSLEMKEVTALAGGEVINRPHIAQAMVEKGYVQNRQEAFDRFLGQGASAYVPKEVFTPADSIRFIHDAGGVAVLAHPDQLQAESLEKTLDEIRCLKEMGIDGVEAYHGSCHPEISKIYADFALELGLVVTGGSDFHGDLKHDVELGQTRSLPFIPYKILERIKEFLAQRRSPLPHLLNL